MLRTFMITALGVIALCLSGCSAFKTRPAADTAAAAEQTAYYTCGGCHGPKNVRVEFMTPKIIGQKKNYIAQKLRDFRDGKRIHPFMNGVSQPLSEQDIINLASYYASYEQK